MMAAPAEARRGPFVREVLGRSDYAIISNIVEPDTRVLDVGCGDGELLQWLAEHKGVDASGVEIVGSRVQRAIARGVSVYQGDIDQGLADYPDSAFDYVILSQTLQETLRPRLVLREMLRVGREAIVSFPNFGHWSARLQVLAGRMPVSSTLPYEWYETPNLHHCTVTDFEDLCRKIGIRIGERLVLHGGRPVTVMPNLLGSVAVYRCTAQ